MNTESKSIEEKIEKNKLIVKPEINLKYKLGIGHIYKKKTKNVAVKAFETKLNAEKT